MLYLIYLSGIVWCLPLALFVPSVGRIWRGTADALDVILSPIAFISANQIGYALRWVWFHRVVSDMGQIELAMWAGLYTLSIVSAISSVIAWGTIDRVAGSTPACSPSI